MNGVTVTVERQVLDDATLREVLNDVTMQNSALDFHWRFEVQPFGMFGWLVNVNFRRPDTSTGVMGTGRSRNEIITFGASESSVVKTCWLLIELTIRHELLESFRWKGKRIFNPHNTVSELASLQGPN